MGRIVDREIAEACSLWLRGVRMFLYREFHAMGVMRVSVNDVYEGILAGKISPPPKGSDPRGKRDSVLRGLFLREYYTRTEDTVVSVKPTNKGRKVPVWKFDMCAWHEACDTQKEGVWW